MAFATALFVTDLLVLQTMDVMWEQNHTPRTLTEIKNAINETIRVREIPTSHTLPVQQVNTILRSLKKLREAGLLEGEPDYPLEYRPSGPGLLVLQKRLSKHWATWPVETPFDSEGIHWERARYDRVGVTA